MYKILIYIDTKSKNKWYFYQENNEDWSCDNLQDLRTKILELALTYGKDNIKAVNQRCGDDQNNVLEFMYIRSIEEILEDYCVRDEINKMIQTALINYTVPTATVSDVGGVRVASMNDATTGIGLGDDGMIATVAATEMEIDAHEDNHAVITPSTLNYAVRSVVNRTSDIENDSDFTTTAYVDNTLMDYSTTKEVEDTIHTTLNDYSTTVQVEETIATTLNDYSTTKEVEKKVQDGLVSTTREIEQNVQTTLMDYSTTAQVEETIATTLADYSTTEQVAQSVQQTLTDYSTTQEVEKKVQDSLVDYSTTQQVEETIATTLNDYSTTTQVEETIQANLADYTTTTQVEEVIQANLTDYTTTTQVEEVIGTTLNDYSTTQEVEETIQTSVNEVNARIDSTLGNIAEALAEINGGV